MLQFLFDTLSRTGDLALIALGLSLVYGMAKFPNIAHVQYAMVGTYVSVGLQRIGAPLALSILAAALAVGFLAMVCQLVLFRRLLRAGPAIAMIGSMALAMVMVAVVLGSFGSSPLQYQLPVQPPLILGGAIVSQNQLISMTTTLVLLVFFAIILFKTRLGRSLRAMACNVSLASAAGLNTEAITRLVNFLGGGLAGLGGAILALNTGAYNNLGNDLLLPIFAAAVLGGLGNPLGAVAGTLIIALAETFVTNLNIGWLYGQSLAFIPAGYISAASFIILLLALILRPYGIFNREVRRV